MLNFFNKLKKLIAEEMQNNKEFKPNNLSELLSNNKTLVTLSVIIFLIGTMLLNVCISSLQALTSFSIVKISEFSIFKSLFRFILIFKYPLVYLIFYILLSIPIIKLIFDIKKSFSSLENGQKGTSRFTTIEEIQNQYKEVPDSTQTYKGAGGVPISRYKDKIYIDTSPVNNLIIGTTRSGKGEMFVVPTIDVYSRAEEQPSLILNDPKGELIAMSKETLEERGYRVEMLNLLNPLNSIGYNPLQLIIDAYKNKQIDEAQSLCKTLTYALYYNPSAKDPFWQNSAMTLVNALILAIIDECINKCKIIDEEILNYEKKISSLKEEKENKNIDKINNFIEKNNEAIKNLENKKEKENGKITLFTVANMLSELGGATDENGKNKLDEYFQKLPSNSVAKMQYATSKFADGSARGSIFSVAMSELSRFTMESIAKMTSKNSIDLKDIGFNKYITKTISVEVKEKLENDKEFIFYEETNLENKSCFFGIKKIEIKKGYKPSDEALLKKAVFYGSKGSKISNYIKVDIFDLDIDTIGKYEITYSVQDKDYENKPVALFIVTPDYDGSNHILASIFIRQVYYILSKEASLFDTGKCEREVVFLLDEFGNMPAIEGMANIITVCLGRKIRFNMIIQSYSQLKKLYGEDDKTIVGNCGNIIYILTNDNETAEDISKALGDKTIVTQSRSGEVLDVTKNRTENLDNRRLLMPEELKAFKEGETVVLRVIKRQDLYKNKIVPYPIFNHGETSLKYRHEYLNDDFDNSKVFNKIRFKSPHKKLKLDDLLINFDETYEIFKEKLNDDIDKIFNKEKVNNTVEEGKREEIENNKDIELGKFLADEYIAKLNNFNRKFAEFRQVTINKDTNLSYLAKLYENNKDAKLKKKYEEILNKLENHRGGEIIDIN